MLYPVYVQNSSPLSTDILLPIALGSVAYIITGNATLSGLLLLAMGFYYLFKWGGLI